MASVVFSWGTCGTLQAGRGCCVVHEASADYLLRCIFESSCADVLGVATMECLLYSGQLSWEQRQ